MRDSKLEREWNINIYSYIYIHIYQWWHLSLYLYNRVIVRRFRISILLFDSSLTRNQVTMLLTFSGLKESWTWRKSQPNGVKSMSGRVNTCCKLLNVTTQHVVLLEEAHFLWLMKTDFSQVLFHWSKQRMMVWLFLLTIHRPNIHLCFW